MFNKKLWKRKTMNNYKKLESGRSMIEMLGVLAIIGVLSVGGIAGYSKAMNKFKTNKVADNVSMLVANIKTLYAQQNTYTGLSNLSAVQMGVVPDELVDSKTESSGAITAVSLKNSFNGDVIITSSDSTGANDGKAFIIEFDSLSKEACITLATNDWGSGYSSGLIALQVNNVARVKDTSEGAAEGATKSTNTLSGVYIGDDGTACPSSGSCSNTIATPGGKGQKVPLNVVQAAKACSCDTGNNCAIAWKYY